MTYNIMDVWLFLVVLDEKTIVRLARVFRRWTNQRRGKEAYNSKPTLRFLWLNVKWVFEFNRMKKDLFKELSCFGDKVKIFKQSKNAYEFILQKYYN